MTNKLNNYAFIDSQNLNLSAKDQGWTLDFNKFHTYLKHKFRTTKSFIFIGYMAGNESLYTYLQNAGQVLVFKPILEVKGKIKGNVDAELVLHSMIEYDNYDKAVIVSGDGDFRCMVEYLEKQNKLERLVIPNKYKYSTLLKKFGSKGKIAFLNKKLPEMAHKKRKA